jgi:hypothetical protein
VYDAAMPAVSRFSRFREFLVSNFKALSSFRKAFVALSLAGVPSFISVGWAVQAANVLEGLTSAIWWFTVAAIDATLFFWLWEEIAERVVSHRRAALILMGAIVIVFYYRGVHWANATAAKASLESQIKDERDGLQDYIQKQMYNALIKKQNGSQPTPLVGNRTASPVVETAPSFTFVVPGVVINGNGWDFIVNHRGKDPSFNVEILFIDDVKKDQVLKGKTSLTVEDINSYENILRFPEIDPRGRGSIFATQFFWTPPVFEHEKYTVEITSREGSVHQQLQVEQLSGKWFWATQITDGESGKMLVNCKDKGFPYGPPQNKACFPEMLQPEI